MTQAPAFKQLCVIGLGLIGGSLAQALRAADEVGRVVAWGRNPERLEIGKKLGVIDDYSLDLAEAVAGSDIVLIGTPTQIAEQTLRDLAPLMREDMIVTDVASVKGNLQRAAQTIWSEWPENLVLGHPIAGSEQSGVEASRADLFRHHRVILTPQPANPRSVLARVRLLWELAGAEVVEMDVDTHDRVLARTSHLPHVLAYALVDALAQGDTAEDVFRFAAGGFKDFTRIASSDPTMWHDIALANRDALLESMDDFSANLQQLREAIERGDGDTLATVFQRAKTARDERFLPQYRQRAALKTELKGD